MTSPSSGACPICGRPRHPNYAPFCSKRCADVDLGRWFSGQYAIPVDPDDIDLSQTEEDDPSQR